MIQPPSRFSCDCRLVYWHHRKQIKLLIGSTLQYAAHRICNGTRRVIGHQSIVDAITCAARPKQSSRRPWSPEGDDRLPVDHFQATRCCTATSRLRSQRNGCLPSPNASRRRHAPASPSPATASWDASIRQARRARTRAFSQLRRARRGHRVLELPTGFYVNAKEHASGGGGEDAATGQGTRACSRPAGRGQRGEWAS
ncbi:hypothetical protein DAEQUDRAFT_96876 [Daedalea quercina L-15889]|uniref:Uncharacterized protein n=1 Tax=Daedalea quercina L-15889 TaxID=1314783 RepID=A0A165SBZ5_9APHY|nr:hypothetical protein DAEQUDRAFT_96876 [Daedalea quercina L-15889]